MISLRVWGTTFAGLFRATPAEHVSMFAQDVKYGLRLLRKNPAFAILAVLTLTLGIGANTAIFTVLRSVLLRPLPYRQSTQLVVFQQQTLKSGAQNVPFSVLDLEDYRQQTQSFSELVEYHGMSFILLGNDTAERVKTGVVSPHFFEMFGVKPILGRTFTEADDKPGAPAVLILSYEYWQHSQRGDPNVIGKTFQMNDRVHTVVGVLPPVPQYPSKNDVYMPTSACPFRSAASFIANRDSRMMSAFARLRPGVSVEQARTELATIATRLERNFPDSYPQSAGYSVLATPLQQRLTEKASPTLLVLFIAAAFVLLIACANVANLTLAKTANREKELVLRLALGAGQSRLLRQLITEGLLIAVPSALLGLAFASGTLKLLTQFVARITPRAGEIRMDGWVLAFAISAAVLTSIFFGSLAALRSRETLGTTLKEGAGQSGHAGAKRTQSVLVITQVAFSSIILIGAGLMMRSLFYLQKLDPGFVPERVLAMRLDPNWSKHATFQQSLDLGRRILANLESQPGFISVAMASGSPMSPDGLQNGPRKNAMDIQGHTLAPGEDKPLVTARAASTDYFKTLGIPLVRGRVFTDADSQTAPQVAVINQLFSHEYWPDTDPIGRKISNDGGATWLTIVGVVGNVREFGLDQQIESEVYYSLYQNPSTGAVLIRTAADPHAVEMQARRAIQQADSQTAISNLQTLEEARADSLTSPRVTAELLMIFAALALVIATAGVGGVLALLVSQRTREIGIRMALGAEQGTVLRMVMGQGLAMIAVGLALGCGGAFFLTRLIKSLLYGTTATDPETFIGVALVFIVAGVLACYIPARRATQVDPLIALRGE
jgi:putative ABC transport system permease protein